jgi:hypothetical protein
MDVDNFIEIRESSPPIVPSLKEARIIRRAGPLKLLAM